MAATISFQNNGFNTLLPIFFSDDFRSDLSRFRNDLGGACGSTTSRATDHLTDSHDNDHDENIMFIC